VSAAYDVVVIGGGANGLVASTVLARSGLRVLVAERTAEVGGQCRALPFAPGFSAAPLATDSGWLPPGVARAAGLEALRSTELAVPLTLAQPGGEALPLWADSARAAEALRRHSAADAARWPAFTARVRRLAEFLQALYVMPAPDVDVPAGDWLPLLGLARKFRGLGREDMIEFLRFLPSSIAELLDDAFESAPLKAALAAGGVLDHRQGPRSGGTGFVWLHRMVGAAPGAMRGRGQWADGPGAFTRAALGAAQAAGVTIRTGAEVVRIEVRNDAVTGVVLANGDVIEARRVLSTADPARTLLGLVDPVWLDPEFLRAVGAIRHRGCAAFVLYALDALPEMPGVPAEALGGTITLTPTVEALERAADAAKYAEVSQQPHVEVTIPSVHDRTLAPEGKHVLVARAQYAPWRLAGDRTWDDAARRQVAEPVTAAIANAIPCFGTRVLHRETLTPRDLEERFALTEGAPTHGELSLDQILFMRPVAGWGRHAMPVRGLYLGGAGTHPGPGITGGPGWLAARRLIADGRAPQENSR
jgi:phytoene dehydrogenase-like protein